MIPKIIHYCWFGHNPLPPFAVKCIDSWRKFLPDYKIKEWNENNFNVNITQYTKDAYKAKKYAFVSDYARFWILYHEGGLYFDTDVEIIRPIDDIIAKGSFMGCEQDAYKNGRGIMVNPGLGVGAPCSMDLYAKFLDLYSTIRFLNPDNSNEAKTIVEYTTEVLIKSGLENKPGIQIVQGIYIYPCEYFCPIDNVTKKKRLTANTRTIHHYAGSWRDKSAFEKIFGNKK